MALFNQPPADPAVLRRTSNLGQVIQPRITAESKLPSDLILRARGVTFESAEKFPIIQAGETWKTQLGDHVIVKTNVNGQKKNVETVDVGTPQKLVVGAADAAAAKQAVSESADETAAPTPTPTAIAAKPTDNATPVDVTAGQPGQVTVTTDQDISYTATDPNQSAAQAAAQNAYLNNLVNTQHTGTLTPIPQGTLTPVNIAPDGTVYQDTGTLTPTYTAPDGTTYQNTGTLTPIPDSTPQDDELTLLALQGQL